jgi:glycerol uptake facilitator-like aquaporin
MNGAVRQLAAELLGTAILVATVVGSGIMAETLAAGNVAVALLANTIATGAILFVLITIFGPVSGAHFNPAVTVVFALRGEVAWAMVGAYAAAQVMGGIAGALLAHAMFAEPLLQLSTHVRHGPTFALVLTILGAVRHRSEATPVAVALVIVAGYWFTASTSFANPAVTIARALSNTFAGIAPADVPAFIAAQFAGALLALGVGQGIFGWTPTRSEKPTLAAQG